MSNVLYGTDLLVLGDFNVPDFSSHVSGSASVSTSCRIVTNFINFYNLKKCNDILNTNDRLLDLVMVSEPIC
jgi:hypothetical protein